MSDPGQVLSARQPQTYRPGMKRGTIRTLHDSKWVLYRYALLKKELLRFTALRFSHVTSKLKSEGDMQKPTALNLTIAQNQQYILVL